jgi:putative endonuclease
MDIRLSLSKKVVLNTQNNTWFLYLLECNNGHYYAGITNDLQARFAAHLSGKGARYTRANPPVRIMASKMYADRSSASVAEAQLKKLPRNKKLAFFDEYV